MLHLVTGGSGSGKSEYAEKLVVEYSREQQKRYYIATMKPYDEECDRRIERHREMRADRGFETIECYEKVESLEIEKDSIVLLECLSNLLANEMYGGEQGAKVVDYIHQGLLLLEKKCIQLIIVTNEVFSDGISYEKETMEYIKRLGVLNTMLTQQANTVTEVVCGIPQIHRR